MNKNKDIYVHLINNLERISYKNSIFNYKSGKRAFLSLEQGNIREWKKKFLPTTRLILEPRIIGSSIGIQYINGILQKAINENSEDITNKVRSIGSVPKSIPIKQRIEIQGILYKNKNSSDNNGNFFYRFKKKSTTLNRLNFCAFHIFHCKINQFQSLKELKKLNFQIPETHFTNFISDIEIYHHCWKEGKLFKKYPTSGIVVKINSRKLQKYLGENKLTMHWAYAIN